MESRGLHVVDWLVFAAMLAISCGIGKVKVLSKTISVTAYSFKFFFFQVAYQHKNAFQ